jgi:hypothetical protein
MRTRSVDSHWFCRSALVLPIRTGSADPHWFGGFALVPEVQNGCGVAEEVRIYRGGTGEVGGQGVRVRRVVRVGVSVVRVLPVNWRVVWDLSAASGWPAPQASVTRRGR